MIKQNAVRITITAFSIIFLILIFVSLNLLLQVLCVKTLGMLSAI